MTKRVPFRRTLAFQTVAGVVLLLAAVLAVTGGFITLTAQRTLDAQLDDAVRQAMARSASFTGGDQEAATKLQPSGDGTAFPANPSATASPSPTTSASPPAVEGPVDNPDPLAAPGQPVGVLSVEVVDGQVERGTYLSSQGTSQQLSQADMDTLMNLGLAQHGQAVVPEEADQADLHRVELSLGSYCVGAVELGSKPGSGSDALGPSSVPDAAENADTNQRQNAGDNTTEAAEGAQAGSQRFVITGLPTEQVEHTRDVLITAVLGGSAAALVVTALLGLWWVRHSLRPLAQVSSSAARVAALPLESGEVPVRHHLLQGELAQPGTEIGDVGYALNLLLINIDDALQQRNASETQLRQFVADASHELRTPLASVRGYADMLRLSEQLSPQGRSALERLLAQAQRMGGLVEDLLLLARLDAGRVPESKPVDFDEIVAEAVMDATAAGPQHKWDLEVPTEPVVVSGDAVQLAQVVGNLLSNARKHTPAGTSVRASLHTRGRVAVLHVDDDGPGVPADLRDHLFDRFTRSDTARTFSSRVPESGGPERSGQRPTEGSSEGSTGLGLAIVRTVVEAHGGEATVESPWGATGRGTRFTVRLPLAGAGPGDSHDDGQEATTGTGTGTGPKAGSGSGGAGQPQSS